MNKKNWIIFFLGAWLFIGTYSCRTKKGCDCPTFGNHATTKTGVFKANAKNHKNR